MSTSYDVIYKKFYKRLVNDTQFFNYQGLTEERIKELVADHTLDLLNQSIDEIYRYGKPEVDFYDKDDELLQFNFDLVSQEIPIFVDLMYQKYFDEDKNKLKAFGLQFTSDELNVICSPANDRKTFLEMVNKLELKNINTIKDYLTRDRKTWLHKSIYQQ
jgi:hypothetical protein